MKELENWGVKYAGMISKIATAYRKEDMRVIRFLDRTILKFIPPHLLRLVKLYKTIDELAGAHLGDDFLAGRTVEWNLGAVGGLDEGYRTAQQVKNKHLQRSEKNNVLSFVEKDPINPIRSALSWAYESFTIANSIEPVEKPLIVFLEHDDLYGSTVSICERLQQCGEKTELRFHHELSFKQGRLVTSEGRPIDLVYLDHHFEDLWKEHPLLQAVENNIVAVDCSPFAHLVLRSKVILALLCLNAFQRAIRLDLEEIDCIKQFLMPTFLWRCKTLTGSNGLCPEALEALGDHFGIQNKRCECLSGDSSSKVEGIVIKAAVGMTYGGKGVATLLAGNRSAVREASKLIRETLLKLSSRITEVQSDNVIVHARDKLTSIVYNSIMNCLADLENREIWEPLATHWIKLIKTGTEKGDHLSLIDELLNIADELVLCPLGVSFDELKNENPSNMAPLEKGIERLLAKEKQKKLEKKSVDACLRQMGNLISRFKFNQPTFREKYKSLSTGIAQTLKPGETLRFKALMERVMKVIDNFFEAEFDRPMNKASVSAIQSLLLQPFFDHQLKNVNPIVIQPFSEPEALKGFDGFHVSTRTHVLFTKQGTHVIVSGGQLFCLEAGKPDNRKKMTASFWIRGNRAAHMV